MSRAVIVADVIRTQARQLKMPALARSFEELGRQARAEHWPHEDYLHEALAVEIASRAESAVKQRLHAAAFPEMKTLDEFDFATAEGVSASQIAELARGDWLARGENVLLAGPIGTGKTHLAIALGIRACLAGHRVRFATATEWVARLAEAKRDGRLEDELAALGRIPLLIVDEVGYIPFDPHAANLMFALVSSRYERASMIVTSNKPFSRWGEIFGDDVVAAAMIDRLVHHAEILSLKGDSYRLKDKDLGSPPPAKTPEIG
jgi:DNA replication protein DnaC